MTSHTDSIAVLNTLLGTDPELQTALRQTADIGQFVQTASACAQRHGMALNANELQTQLQARLEEAAAGGHPGAELTDLELMGVAGGSIPLVTLTARLICTSMLRTQG